MSEHIIRISIEKSFPTEAAALQAWNATETVIKNGGWTITSQACVKQG